MQRRKFLTGLGALTAGGAAAMGTGAFNFANVERSVSINMADDSAAFLALEDTSRYANEQNNGKLRLTFDDDATVGGSGINHDSDYSFTGVFAIRNQGSQSVGVWINDNDDDDAAGWYGVATNNDPDFNTSIEGSGNAYALNVGEAVYVNVVLLNRDPRNPSDLPTEINIVADASAGN